MAVAFGTGARLVAPVAALLLGVLFAAQVALLASLGVWVSVVFGTTRRALVAMTVLLVLLIGGSSVALNLDGEAQAALSAMNRGPPNLPGSARVHYYEVGLNPFHAWVFLATSGAVFKEDGPRHPLYAPRVRAVAGGAALSAVLAGVLWLDAVRRFRRYQER
jgi:hypothetical protein